MTTHPDLKFWKGLFIAVPLGVVMWALIIALGWWVIG